MLYQLKIIEISKKNYIIYLKDQNYSYNFRNNDNEGISPLKIENFKSDKKDNRNIN